MDKRALSERDICTKFITPALRGAGWDEQTQFREEVYFTKGRITVRGKLVARGKAKRADYILYIKPNIPLAVIEAKDNNHSVGDGIQQALGYAETLKIPFVFSSNGDGFIFHDRTGASPDKETELGLDAFPSPSDLWARYCVWKGLTPEAEEVVLEDYFDDGSGKEPRYYQVNAVNAAIEAIAKGRDRILLVMATGTGKTYTAFQIIWRLWKAGRKKRILFLADRNILIDQTMVNDFRPFGPAMAKLSTKAKTIERADGSEVDLTLALDSKRRIDTAYEIYLGLYQAITGPEERQKLFKEFSPGFFDLIVIDECHRGSAADDAAWREILDYFSGATQIGLTATPKETEYVSNSAYFGDPVFTYSLRQGISDGFLAPYKVIKVHIDRDVEGYANALPCSLAWQAFGDANGARAAQEMRARIARYRRADPGDRSDFEVGCRILTQPFFLEEADWIPVPPSWATNIVSFKTYNTETTDGLALWEAVQDRVAGARQPSVGEPEGRFGEPQLIRPRLGQGAFRVLVTDIYRRRCAVTGERTLPALEAAHIRPYGDGGEHEARNGLLLRRDIHSLFDAGYVTVTPDRHFEVSRRIKEEFDNGRHYYALHGQLITVPDAVIQGPDPAALAWHNENCFRG